MRAAAAQIEIEKGSWYRYVGQMQREKYHGQGVVSYADGDRYEGEWRNQRANGHGTMTHADGFVQSGQWKDSNFLG